MNRKEGFIKVPGGKVWYEIVGKKKGTPLILLHGGPGYPHDYLEPLEDLSDIREVIFYDQLGCGNSDRPDDTSLWTIDRFVVELKDIVKHLDLNQYHILGHSWGAALAISFALTKPKGLVSLILSDPYISTPRWEEDSRRLIQSLPKDIQEILKRHQKDKVYDSEELKNASKVFHDKFIHYYNPSPEAFLQSRKKKNDTIYNYMWGPEEFWITGTLKNFDPTRKLPDIKIPVLLLCGRNDEATPESTEYFQSLFPNAQMKVFEKSEHTPFWNQRHEYIQTIQQFLQSIEK